MIHNNGDRNAKFRADQKEAGIHYAIRPSFSLRGA
jgi:hypothetical protein